jgi:beta-glucosidase
MTDGPVGIRWDRATALPAAVAMASTWDRDLMLEVGNLIGTEARARGRNFFLGPCVNIHRFPVGGRNFESYGEDPYLAGQIAVPLVKGVQEQNVLACPKHYVANNQEWKRTEVNVVVDERVLHEIYLPAFRAAVVEGGAWTVMSSYNKVNGLWASENPYLLTEVLKEQWGFKGFVVSDWGATHSTAATANAGLDLEMPFGKYFNEEMIKDALDKGEITEAVIDDKVRRLLRVRYLAGHFDEQTPVDESVIHSEEHKQIAYKAATNGTVLLKNEGNLLPLKLDELTSIAVIGPNAAVARVGGGGSAKVTPFYAISPLEGLKDRLGDKVELRYALGTVIKDDIHIIESEYLNGGTGFSAQYFNNEELEGESLFTRTDADVNFLWYYDAPRFDNNQAVDRNKFSVRWTGKLLAPAGGIYKFHVMHNDGARLMVGGELILDVWDDGGSRTNSAEIELQEGTEYDIQLE